MLNDLYTLEISHMINLCKYIAVNVLQTEKTFFCIYRTQKMPKTVMEKLKDMVTFSLIIWRGDLCLYSCRSKTRTSAWKTRITPGSLAEEYIPSHRDGRKCLVWQRDTLCCCHAQYHPGLLTASLQWYQKCKRCGKQRNPESHSVWLQLHCASCDTAERSSTLGVHLAACPLTQVETPQPQTSMPHLAGVNRKQPVMVRCHCRRRLYIGEYSEMVCTFGWWVQGTRIKVSTKLGGNGETFKLLWVRPSEKPRGSSLSGCSPHFPHSFDVVRRRFFSTRGGLGADSSALALAGLLRQEGPGQPQALLSMASCSASFSLCPSFTHSLLTTNTFVMTTHLLFTTCWSVSQEFLFHRFPVCIVSLISGVSLNWQCGILIKKIFANSFPVIHMKKSRMWNINLCLGFISIMFKQQ